MQPQKQQQEQQQQQPHSANLCTFIFFLLLIKHKLIYFYFAEKASKEEQEDIPVVDGMSIKENKDADDSVDLLQQGLEMMYLGSCPSNLPPTTPGLFVIPPCSYLNVSEGQQYICIQSGGTLRNHGRLFGLPSPSWQLVLASPVFLSRLVP